MRQHSANQEPPMVRTALACLFLILASSTVMRAAEAAATGTTLAGRSFDIVTKAPGKDGKEEKDTLVFTATEGDSTACHQYGFGKGPVTYTAKDGGIGFSFTTKSDKEGTIAWSGTAKGDALSGTMAWTKDGKTQTSDFTGTASAAATTSPAPAKKP
jgi:hypothetical protein